MKRISIITIPVLFSANLSIARTNKTYSARAKLKFNIPLPLSKGEYFSWRASWDYPQTKHLKWSTQIIETACTKITEKTENLVKVMCLKYWKHSKKESLRKTLPNWKPWLNSIQIWIYLKQKTFLHNFKTDSWWKA